MKQNVIFPLPRSPFRITLAVNTEFVCEDGGVRGGECALVGCSVGVRLVGRWFG